MPLRSRLLAPLTAALVAALVTGLLVLAPAPAGAAAPSRPPTGKAGALDPDGRAPSAVFKRSAYLCMGYQACRDAGMGNGGYASNNRTMYWRMYSGHNCTNYAAYRMVKSGLPNERPWSGGGNATFWGSSMSRVTDGTPRVGAVAWWRANTGPAGSSGHVAYVERVVSADEIVISQDSWGGDFSWAVVTRGSGNWPSGFVHFNDKALLNTAAPVVTGTAKVGAVLSSTAGTWRPASATVAYQWLADGRPIKDAVGASLKLTRARLDQVITVRATGSQLGYPTASATSTPTAPVQPGQLRNLSAPTISGEAKVDSSLTLSPGTWNPEPALAFQWLADGQPIVGATGTTLDLGPELVGRVITAQVTATREGYEAVTAAAAPTVPVAPGTFTVTTAPSLDGTARLGETLTVDPGLFRPADAEVQVQWLRDGEPVPDATGTTYQISNLDLGTRLSARITLTSAGYTTTTLDTPRSARVKSDPRIRVAVDRSARRVRVTVTVTAPGVSEVTGPVVVRLAGISQEVTLRHGSARVTFKGLPAGKRTMTVRYAGSELVKRLVTTRTVRVG
ncbi:CHAP domain-containing protein [Nocardioides sp.]|uniref:CHAP domain-containing protein n=1 Tax=Nocardioides sp. TaxID=35761 RepID=UPI0026296E71|nr:CHAP domain-containing protein [Nocardioides sp.]MDI6908323.1 CHAP domain-containing protein [Nocardioides sp.]